MKKNVLAACAAAAMLTSGFMFTMPGHADAKAIPASFDLEAHRGGRDALPFTRGVELGAAYGVDAGRGRA